MGVKAKVVLAEAVEYAKETKSWKFSTCCCCGQRFSDEELNLEHIKSAHLGTLSEELQSVVPKTVPISEIEIGDWSPVNVVAAAKLIEDLSRNDSGNKGQDEGKSQDLKLENLPHCNDTNRGMLIKSIWVLLQLFIEIECFAPSHFYMLLDLILEMLKNQIPEMLLNQRWMKTTLVSVWFLDEPELESVQEFLIEELGISCGLQGLYTSCHRDKARRGLTIPHESIVFRDDDLSHLIPLLDETNELASRSVDDIKSVGQEYRDNIVQWLFTGGEPIGEKLKEWEKYREASKSLGMELFKIIESEFHRLQNMCETKCKYLRHEKLWLDMEGICMEEDKRRKEISGNQQSFRSLLLKRQKDIEKEKSIDEMGSLELDIIESILKKAQADNDIKMLFQMHIDQMGGKCFKSDATILATNAAMQQTWNKLKMVTSYDYRSIVVPLLKTFMRAQLEDMVDKYATEKSNAEIEVLLSELNLNAKNNTGRGGVDARQGQGKSKNKKKKKDHRKAKEFQATGGSEDQQEQTSVPAAHGKDHPLNPEVVGPVTPDELEQEERELTSKAEEECRVEEHRRMLARHLEYQRQIENEAKQKRLAEIDKA
uniref:C2H2-type domain-containing protein n=1 Tax=Quercus lobata TaxID=97700 RepID=A0A7N2LLD6_QUELO